MVPALIALFITAPSNFAFLQQAEAVGREYEAKPYDALTKSAEELSSWSVCRLQRKRGRAIRNVSKS